MDLTIDTITATSAIAHFGSLTAGRSVQLQYSSRADFQLAVSPIVTLTADSPASLALEGLNQDGIYYARAREYTIADGTEFPWSGVAGFRTPLDTPPDLSIATITHEPAMIVAPAVGIAWFADDEVAGFPVENLGYDAPVAWRSVGSPHRFTIQIAPEPIDTIALLMSNCSESCQVVISADTTQAGAEGGAPAFTTGALDFRASQNIAGRYGYHGLFQLPAVHTYAFWSVEITDTLTGDMLHLEHAIFGLNRASKKVAVEKTEAVLDLGAVTRSRSGVPLRALGLRMRKTNFEISAVTEDTFEKLYSQLGPRVGLTEPVLVVPNPKAGARLHDRILYGTLTASQATAIRGALFGRQFTIESIV